MNAYTTPTGILMSIIKAVPESKKSPAIIFFQSNKYPQNSGMFLVVKNKEDEQWYPGVKNPNDAEEWQNAQDHMECFHENINSIIGYAQLLSADNFGNA
jgi:hypothetical protein